MERNCIQDTKHKMEVTEISIYIDPSSIKPLVKSGYFGYKYEKRQEMSLTCDSIRQPLPALDLDVVFFLLC